MALLMQCKNGLCIRVQGIKGGKKEVPQESDMTTAKTRGRKSHGHLATGPDKDDGEDVSGNRGSPDQWAHSMR